MKAKIVSLDVDKSFDTIVELKIRIINISDSYLAYLSSMLRNGDEVVVIERILTEQD